MSKQKRRFQICVPAESQTQKAAVLLFALQFFSSMCTLLDLTVVAIGTSAWLMREVKIPLEPHAIQYLATTAPPINACVMVKEQEGNEIMAIFKEFFEHR